MGEYEYTEAFISDLWRLYASANLKLSRYEPLQLIVLTMCFTLILSATYNYVFDPRIAFCQKIRLLVFFWLRKIPYVRRKIAVEVAKVEKQMATTFNKSIGDMTYIEQLPSRGWSTERTISEANRYQALSHVDWTKGKCSGTVYNGDTVLTSLINKVSADFAWSNPLHADVFPGVRKMEAEIVRMVCRMFNGNMHSCGTMTSGGTESIFMACKAYRELARDKGIRYPNMVIPITAHCAFDKAAGYLDIRVIHVPVDKETYKVNTSAMLKAINSNTCMLVGSAPHFPQGIIDPIEEIASMGLQHDIPVHVDCCLGGFLLPFMHSAGFKVVPFDFKVKGVTSISADTHKYGYAPKGSSVIMYRTSELRRKQFFVQSDWPGGIYASSSVAGSRSGAVIAGCWAAMNYTGIDGYVLATQKILQITRYIKTSLLSIDEIYVMGDPQVSVVALASDVFDIYRLADGMTAKGWNLNSLQFPSSVHICVTLVHTRENYADKFIQDIKDTIVEIMTSKETKCTGQIRYIFNETHQICDETTSIYKTLLMNNVDTKGAIYGMAQSIPDRSIVADIAASYYDSYYNTTR